jgi:ABC-type multidrug transport system permease subunit
VNHDPGLARERTQLAWQRYTLGVAIVAVLSLRAGLVGNHEVAAFAIAFVLAALAAALQLVGPRANPHRAVRLALAASLTAAGGSLVLALL